MTDSHTRVRLTGSLVRFGLVSHNPTRRLVVFVHGFLGRAGATWGEFARTPPDSPWWGQSDLLFVGYRSFFDSASAIADRLRDELVNFFPAPNPELVHVGGIDAREDPTTHYDELVLVGHSLGGVVLRIAIADSADAITNPTRGFPERSERALLNADVRLFSPAIGGFLGTGFLGLAKGILGPVLSIPLSFSSAYSQLQVGSPVLADVRERTERLAKAIDASGLGASIVWASPENIVHQVRYKHDPVGGSIAGKDHMAVCKPKAGFSLPWTFVETGHTR